MKLTPTYIDGLFVLEPQVFNDERGHFLEAYNHDIFRETLTIESMVQENQAYSQMGVLRGLHFQIPPKAQGKLVRCVYGKILDVAVDLRPLSKTFGEHYKVILSHENNHQLWIPAGFAHGALTLSDYSLMAYFCTEYYSPEYARAIVYNDPDLGINWGSTEIICNDRDLYAPKFNQYNFSNIWDD